MSKIIKKADVYLEGELLTREIRITIDITECKWIEEILNTVNFSIKYNMNPDRISYKLISIYFREEEELWS